MIINMRREIIHPAGHINELAVGKAFAHFFDRPVNETEMRFHFFDRLTIQCDHQVQYTVCGRVLGSYVNSNISGPLIPAGGISEESFNMEVSLYILELAGKFFALQISCLCALQSPSCGGVWGGVIV